MLYTIFHSITTRERSGKIIILIREMRLRETSSLSEVVQLIHGSSWIYAQAAFLQSLSAVRYCLSTDKLNIKFHEM